MARRQSVTSAQFAEVYRAHVDFVWRVLARSGVAPEALEDATQEVFIVAHRRFGVWEGQAAIRTWLYGVARKVAATQQRGERRRRRKHAALLPPPAGHGPDQAVAARHELERLARVISTLDPRLSEVLILTELEGLSGPEIAELLGVELNTVYTRLRRARARVAARFEQQSAGERALRPLTPESGAA